MEAAEEAGDGDAVAEIDLTVWVDGVGQPPTRVPATIRDAVRGMDVPLYDKDRVMGRPVPLDPPAIERLGRLNLPVLAVVGELDLSDVRAAAVRLEEAAGARRVVVPAVAHLVGMEAPERLAELIVEFARPLPRWT